MHCKKYGCVVPPSCLQSRAPCFHLLNRCLCTRSRSSSRHRSAYQLSPFGSCAHNATTTSPSHQEALACSGRLNLCAKTRELTDNQPKYKYRQRKSKSPAPNGGGGGQEPNAGGKAAGGRKRRGEKNSGGLEGTGEAVAGAVASYRDSGDRLYSEAKEAQRRHDARRRKVEAAGEVEGWSCPKCGAANR